MILLHKAGVTFGKFDATNRENELIKTNSIRSTVVCTTAVPHTAYFLPLSVTVFYAFKTTVARSL